MVNALIEYVHPTNWELVNADVLGLLNFPLNINLESDGGYIPAPWIMKGNLTLYVQIEILLKEGSYQAMK